MLSCSGMLLYKIENILSPLDETSGLKYSRQLWWGHKFRFIETDRKICVAEKLRAALEFGPGKVWTISELTLERSKTQM